MTTAKNSVFIELYLENCCLVEKEKEPSESYVEEASETERLIEEIKQLKRKNECLQKKNNMFEENEPRFLSEASVKIKNNLVVLLV